MKGILIFILLFLLPLHTFAEEITVAATANIGSALEELKVEFEKDSGDKLKVIIGSSGKLTTQIENGAPFDIFMSADMKYPQTLFEEGLAAQAPKVYAYGVLVLWSTKNLDLSTGVNVLTGPEIKKIALANPQVAPYGREAVNVLKYYKLYSDVTKRLVYGESIAQANDFISTQSADIGFTSKSTVLSPDLKDKGVWTEIPAESYNRIAQGMIILKHGKKNNLETAQKFYDFVFSAKAKSILKKYGYLIDE